MSSDRTRRRKIVGPAAFLRKEQTLSWRFILADRPFLPPSPPVLGWSRRAQPICRSAAPFSVAALLRLLLQPMVFLDQAFFFGSGRLRLLDSSSAPPGARTPMNFAPSVRTASQRVLRKRIAARTQAERDEATGTARKTTPWRHRRARSKRPAVRTRATPAVPTAGGRADAPCARRTAPG